MEEPQSTIELLETAIVELENQLHDVRRMSSSPARHRSQDDLNDRIAQLVHHLSWLHNSAARFRTTRPA
jgi:hypothetical protein